MFFSVARNLCVRLVDTKGADGLGGLAALRAWIMLMAVKLPCRPCRPQLVSGSCSSPNRPLTVLSIASMRPKLVKPKSAPKML